MAQLKQKKEKEDWVRGKVYDSKTGEKITILEPFGKDWVKILNGNGKIELITKTQLAGRLNYGQQNSDNIRHGY